MAVTSSQSDVERVFSRSGRVARDQCSTLTSDHVNQATTLAYWLDESEEGLHGLDDGVVPTKDQVKVIERYNQFLSSSLDPEKCFDKLKADVEHEDDWADDDSDSDYEDYPVDDDDDDW